MVSAARLVSPMLLLLGINAPAASDSIISQLLAPFADIERLADDSNLEVAKLVKDAIMEMRTGKASLPGWEANGSFTPVDERYLVGEDQMQVLLDLYRKCRTRESWALQTWCVGDEDEFANDTGRLTMCPPGVRTHPCTGRVLPGNWSHDVQFDPQQPVKFLWPWEGIKCEAYTDPTTITHIFLPGEALRCRLDELNFGVMRSLEQLDLSNNMLSGSFPPWVNGMLSELRFLNLSQNQLTGTLQKPFSDCEWLEVLDISHNNLTATSLTIFGSMRRLRHANLAHNPISLKLPVRSFQADLLQYLNLSHCELEGGIPDFPPFRHLVTLDLSHNHFTGTVPRRITFMGRQNPGDPDEESHIEIIDISHNFLSGRIPEFWNASSLRVLAVNDNNFSGRVPDLPPQIAKLGLEASSMFAGNGNLWCPLPDELVSSNISCICGGGYTLKPGMIDSQKIRHNGEAGDLFVESHSLITAINSSVMCSQCPYGTYSNETTGYQCISCPKGWIPVSSVQEVVPGYMWEERYADLMSRGMDRCGQCPPGSFININSSSEPKCQLCPPGTANPKPGQYACVPCAAGHFSAYEGAEACNACNPGTYTDMEGSIECSLCPPGTFSRWATHANNTGIAECLPCSRGFYQDLPGSPKCIPCPDGMVARLPGMSKCLSCQPGSYIDPDTKSCMSCEPGTFSTSEGASECDLCPPGTTTETLGSQVCYPTAPSGREYINLSDLDATGAQSRSVRKCQPGTYNSGNFLSCHPCPRGTYTSNAGAQECIDCLIGSFAPDSGMTKCIDAPAGYFVGKAGAWKPTRCSAGQYSPHTGSSSCENCPDGTFAVLGGGLACEQPRIGEILQRVEWPRVQMTLLGMTLDDYHERFDMNATGELPSSNASIANTHPAKAVTESVRLALDLFAVENVKVHAIGVERASIVEELSNTAIDLAIEKVPRQLPNRGKQHSESFKEQFRAANVSALRLSAVTKKKPEQEPTHGEDAISSLLGGVQKSFNVISQGDSTGPASEIQANNAQGLGETVSSEGFRTLIGRNLGLFDSLQRPIPMMLVQMKLLSDDEAWRTTRAVACPPGSFFSSVNRTCELCSPGFFGNESGVTSCRECPKGSFSDEPGMEACEECKLGWDSRAGSTRCTKCSWFTSECSDFAEHILITTALALALVWKVYRRLRAAFYGDRQALQRSEDTVLLATVRTYGRTFGGARYAAMGEVSASTLWSPPGGGPP